MTEERMLAGCVRNDAASQDALYHRFSPRMLGVCYRYARNQEDAEDMLQEGFIRVFKHLSQFRNEGSLEGWIRRTIVHTCINFLKKNKKFADTVDISEARELLIESSFVTSALETKDIIECIRQLPIGYRTVLNLFAIEGYSHKEIGCMLDIGESSSRSQYMRAKNLLEKILISNGILERPGEQKKTSA